MKRGEDTSRLGLLCLLITLWIDSHFLQGQDGSYLTQESVMRCFYIMHTSQETGMPLFRRISTFSPSTSQNAAIALSPELPLCQGDGGHSFSSQDDRSYSQGLYFTAIFFQFMFSYLPFNNHINIILDYMLDHHISRSCLWTIMDLVAIMSCADECTGVPGCTK